MTTVQANIFAILDGEDIDDVQQLVEHVTAKASSRPSTTEKAENNKDKKVQHTDNDHWRQGHNGNYQQNYGAYPRGGRGGSFRGRGGRGEIRAFQLHNQSKDVKEKEAATLNGNQVILLGC